MKANLLSSTIFRVISYHSCKVIARDHKLFPEVRLETRTKCNGRCDFCPASVMHETRPDTWMSEECYKKIIDELADMNYQGVVKLYINNEPLMDNRMVDFLAYLKSKELDLACVCIQTNGILLTPELGEGLFNNGLTWLIVDDYFYSDELSLKKKEVVEHLQRSYPDKRIELLLRSPHEVLRNRGGTAPNKRIAVEIRASCTRPFWQLNITANGDVGLCCWDFYVTDPLGNVNVNSLQEIWRNKKYTSLRRNLLRGDRTMYKLCKNCEFKGYHEPPKKYRKIYNRLSWFAQSRLDKQIEGAVRK